MFGYVTASWKELSKQEKDRYGSIYCGICRRIREQSGGTARIALSYDMAFLALLLMSLYEPEEASGTHRCPMHPLQKRQWYDNEFIRYGADMNVALAYFNFLDDWQDDGKPSAKIAADLMGRSMERIREAYPRQCEAMERCIRELNTLEKAGCSNPDEPARAFGTLLGELLAYRENCWRIGRTFGPRPCDGWAMPWAGSFIWRTRPSITGLISGRRSITPIWLWVPVRIGPDGRNIWCWQWEDALPATKCCPWCRTRRCWITFCTAACGPISGGPAQKRGKKDDRRSLQDPGCQPGCIR